MITNNKTFKKSDLKLGYVVICNGVPHMVMCAADNKMAIVDNEGRWIFLASFNNDLCCTVSDSTMAFEITEVYGYSRWHFDMHIIDTRNRELIWKRGEPAKKMTVEEIEKELGYKVEIVGGHQ